MVIADETLSEFKARMHLEDNEDQNLTRILTASVIALKRDCGDYDVNTDESFKELVFERARYVYNDALEYFNDNFLNMINSLGIAKALDEISLEGDADAEV